MLVCFKSGVKQNLLRGENVLKLIYALGTTLRFTTNKKVLGNFDERNSSNMCHIGKVRLNLQTVHYKNNTTIQYLIPYIYTVTY